jgi:hypothetical protein
MLTAISIVDVIYTHILFIKILREEGPSEIDLPLFDTRSDRSGVICIVGK